MERVHYGPTIQFNPTASYTRDISKVTCPACLEALGLPVPRYDGNGQIIEEKKEQETKKIKFREWL